MIHFTMLREPSQGGATLSKLFLGLDFLCDVLEDEVREIPGKPVSEWKIKGHTAIPAGTYEIEARQSGHFGPDTLTLLDVPGFQYIRIHAGNYANYETFLKSVPVDTTKPVFRSAEYLDVTDD